MAIKQKISDGAGGPKKSIAKMFFSGVVALTFSNIIVKAIGLFFKIPLIHYLGELGMGYFNAAYTIYTWFYMISTAGLPVAISILVSEARAKGNYRQVKRIFRISETLFFAIGLLGMVIMAAGSGLFSALMKSPDSAWCIVAIAPTLFFICISSSIRGYFQGFQNMIPTAVSQVIEAAGKLLIGIFMAKWALDMGYELHIAAAFSIAGLTVGVAAGMFFLVISKLLFKESAYGLDRNSELEPETRKSVLARLVKIAVPIMVSSSVMSLTNMIDLMIVLRRLQDIGFAREVAVAMYGNYTTLAVPLYNLPPVLIYPIAYSIVPMLSAAKEEREKKKTERIVASTLRVAVMIALPCALGLSAMSRGILDLLFHGLDSSVSMAAPLLSILALSCFFVCVLAVTNSILQANGYERKPIISMLTGAAVKLASSYILIGIPEVGMYGTPISTFICYAAVCAMNFYFIAKHVCPLPSPQKLFVKPLAASAVCVACALLCSFFAPLLIGSTRISTLLSIFIAALIYVAAIFLFGAIKKEDVAVLPKSEKIYRILNKLKLMK